MKHPNRIIINIIIQNLNKIRVPIKPDKQMLVGPAGFFQNSVILDRFKSPTNISFSYAMLGKQIYRTLSQRPCKT
jgi:hypothetical protein